MNYAVMSQRVTDHRLCNKILMQLMHCGYRLLICCTYFTENILCGKLHHIIQYEFEYTPH